MKNIPPFFLLFFLLHFTATQGQPHRIPPHLITSKKILQDFMDQRFGLFIHWGPVSLRGTEIGWSRDVEVPAAEYDQLYTEFNPALFHAEDWVKAAKEAGMRYLTITAKHHDGFLLWPSSTSDYTIKQSPYKKDIVGALAEACRKQGIKFCIYFTVLDWRDPNYPIDHPRQKQPNDFADMNTFVATMKAQLKELITNYNPYMLWFDGNWESPWKDEYAVDIYTFIKQLDPSIIINNRIGDKHGDHSKLGTTILGDFATPEQKIGELNMEDPWETCMTIGQQWSWKPNDSLKSLKTCIQTLSKVAAGNGNLLFNVGPMMDGRIEARQVALLKGMGTWLQRYGESIYQTKGGPFQPNDTYATTRKGNKLYIHLFEQPSSSFTLPPLPATEVKAAYFLGGEKLLFDQKETVGITIQLPNKLPDQNNSVIVLELSTNAEDIPLLP